MAEPITDPELLSQLNAPSAPSPVTDPNLLGQLNAPMEWADVGSQAVKSIPSSAVEFGKNIVQPFIHPIDTAENIKNLGLGVLEKTGIVPAGEHEKYADAVGQFLKERYGGIENVKHTLATDPVGLAADLSTVLTGGGSLLARAPGVIGKVGEIAGTVGRTVDPLTAAGAALRAGKLTGAGPEQAALKQAGVLMTPGQMVGGAFKTLEDAATSIPLLGSFIQSGRARSVESFNKAVGNQALEPIGERLSRGTKAGHETIAQVEEKLGNAYDNILPSLRFIPDAQYARDMATILSRDVAVLPAEQARQFEKFIQTRIGPPAVMDGQMLKQVQSELTNFSKKYSSSSDAAQRDLADAVDKVNKAIRSNLERSNPGSAEFLQRINSGWAMYARMRSAAARRATSEGVFTPNDLLQSIKGGDKSVGKGSFAKGDALMQTFAEAGQKVLPSKLPTSGTTERGITMGLLGGASHYGYLPPEWLAGAIAAGVPYTRAGMEIGNRVGSPLRLTVRPAFQAGRLQSIDEQAGLRKEGGRLAANRAIAAARARHG